MSKPVYGKAKPYPKIIVILVNGLSALFGALPNMERGITNYTNKKLKG